jgi:hypothetical protein
MVVSLAACATDAVTADLQPPATLQPIEGTDRYRVVLTSDAAARVDLKTDLVTESDEGLSVPSSALVLDPFGQFWVYVNPEPLVYERAALNGVFEANGRARFAEGPPAGTKVVVVGVPELYGQETGIGK